MRKTALVILAVTLLGGCGQPEKAANRGEASVDPTALMIHPVLRESEPPCGVAAPGEEVLPEMSDGKVVSCLAVGPAALDATAVKEAELFDNGEWVVGVELTAAGAERFDQLASEHFGERLAITWRGKLASAPTVQSMEFGGRLQVTGLSRQDAQSLVRDLGGDATPPTTEPIDAELERASAVCTRYAPKLSGGMPLGSHGPWNAGAITQMAKRSLGRTIPPWDSLPDEHFVAACTYQELGDAPRKSKTCPDGRTLSVPVSREFFVDETGRSTENLLKDAPDMTEFLCRRDNP